MAIAMKRGRKETIHLVTIELIKKCNYRVSMLGKPANIKYWLFCHTNFNYCSKHSKSPRKVCVVCKKNESRRKGGLCDACFVDNGMGSVRTAQKVDTNACQGI